MALEFTSAPPHIVQRFASEAASWPDPHAPELPCRWKRG